jgi:REP element-mobilizing transposase RayT
MSELPKRVQLRLPWFDYSSTGAYFVTVCTRNHQCSLGQIVDGAVRLSAIGEMVLSCWNAIPDHFPHVTLDAFVVMPNHVHGVLLFADQRAGHARPLQTVVGSFKAAVSRWAGKTVWQRNYWERVIRNDDELNAIRAYIDDNPLRWPADPENVGTA